MPDPRNDPLVTQQRKIQIWFVGLECAARQESEDEVYGTVGVTIPSTKSVNVHHFPDGDNTFQMGKDGTRTVSVESLIYEGPPADVVLSSTLVEHDSGETEEYRRRIASKLAEAAAMGGAAVGVPSEAVGANMGWINDLCYGIVNVVASFVGADDDPYTPQALRIPAYDMLQAFGVATGESPGRTSPFVNKTMERADTPGVMLKYNLAPVLVSGTDQGGDTGHYTFYYGIDLLQDERKLFSHTQ